MSFFISQTMQPNSFNAFCRNECPAFYPLAAEIYDSETGPKSSIWDPQIGNYYECGFEDCPFVESDVFAMSIDRKTEFRLLIGGECVQPNRLLGDDQTG